MTDTLWQRAIRFAAQELALKRACREGRVLEGVEWENAVNAALDDIQVDDVDRHWRLLKQQEEIRDLGDSEGAVNGNG